MKHVLSSSHNHWYIESTGIEKKLIASLSSVTLGSNGRNYLGRYPGVVSADHCQADSNKFIFNIKPAIFVSELSSNTTSRKLRIRRTKRTNLRSKKNNRYPKIKRKILVNLHNKTKKKHKKTIKKNKII